MCIFLSQGKAGQLFNFGSDACLFAIEINKSMFTAGWYFFEDG
jgi:hypothetical protein